MSGHNDVTGDKIISKVSAAYAANYDAIFKKDKETEQVINSSSEYNIETTLYRIRDWAVQRGLDKAESNRQIIKLGEEFGELCAAFCRKDSDALYDAIGDMVVVLTILAQQQGRAVEWCVEQAYEEIRDRKGKLVNGVFVKDEEKKK